MKGKNTFTQSEIIELRKLIKERIKADSSRQKGIRAKMRRIGFYGEDDFGIFDLQPSDFENLIKSGRIIITGQKKVENIQTEKALKNNNRIVKVKNLINENNKTDLTLSIKNDFKLFDPEKHSSNHIPDKPGNYIICLKKNSHLPNIVVDYEMKLYQDLRVIYTGIAGTSLRKRDYKQHFTGNNAGGSTLRKSIGSMFGYAKIARDIDPSNGKTKFNEIDEIKLSKWMKSNLILFFKPNLELNEIECQFIDEFNPPLNLAKNSNSINKEFRKRLSEIRTKK